MGAFYPVNKDLKNFIKKADNFQNGNFSLWYNKYIPLTDDNNKKNKSFKASDLKGDDSEAISYYAERYRIIAGKAKALLQRKHIEQIAFCQKFSRLSDFEYITIYAKLKTSLITGIGQSHPSEISMVFDRNLGIPYIPASSIKGIVRFAHILSIILDNDGNIKEEFKDAKEIDLSKLDIPDIFGGDKFIESEEKSYPYKGSVIFLDAYPVNIPELKVDIMNPHYGEYYQNDKGDTPPADYLTPVPIKFLTVKEGTEFVFRFVAKKEISDKALKALERVITKEGVGAKTSLGYGLFEVISKDEPNVIIDEVKKIKKSEEEKRLRIEMEQKEKEEQEKLAKMSEVDKLCYNLKKENSENAANEIYKKIDNFQDEDKRKIAETLKDFWININKWHKGLSKKQKAKKKKIEEILSN